MSYDSRMAAMEGMFDPEQTAAKMLDAVKVNVEQNVNTVDAASTLENKLSEEAAQFNTCLTTMANSIRKCERGEISREEMLAECAPCVSMLKTKCTALQLGNVTTSGEDITEEEIAMLSEYITGCKDIVAKRKLELQDDPTATESYGILASLAGDTAMEGIFTPNMAKQLRKSTEAKTANELYKQAKKLYGMGSKEKAVEYMTKAKKLYESCLDKVKKNAKMYKVERSVSKGSASQRAFNTPLSKKRYKGETVQDTFKKDVTDNKSLGNIIAYFEDRIDSCQAYLLQWGNKAGKADFKGTKAQLKEERKAERARIKAEKKAAKNKGGDAAVESYNELYMESLYEATLESYLDFADESFEELAAMEGQNLDARKIKKDYGKQVKTLAKEGKRLMKQGDGKGAAEKFNECVRLTKEMKNAISSLDPSVGSAVLGFFARNIQYMLVAVLAVYGGAAIAGASAGGVLAGAVVGSKVAMGAGAVGAGLGISASITGQAATIVQGIRRTVEMVQNLIKAIKSHIAGNKISATEFNGYIQGLLKACDKAIDSYSKLAATAASSSSPAQEAYEFIEACESYMDSLELELAMEAAMEAEGEEEEGGAKKAGGIAAKLRNAFSKLKKGDKSAASEVAEAADELEEAADEAETPEEKKKLSTAAKVGLAAAAVVATTAGAYALGKKFEASAKKGNDVKGAAKLLKNFAHGADRLVTTQRGVDKKFANVNKGKSMSDKNKRLANANAAQALLSEKKNLKAERLARKNNKKTSNEEPDEDATESWGEDDSILSALVFGLEGFGCDDCDGTEPMEGRGFDDDDMIEDAIEGFEDDDLDDLATEAAIAVMMAEDGIEE